MQRKLTIAMSDDVIDALHAVIGPRKIGKFIEDLVRPLVTRPGLEAEYSRMASAEAREAEALEWAEATVGDATHEAR